MNTDCTIVFFVFPKVSIRNLNGSLNSPSSNCNSIGYKITAAFLPSFSCFTKERSHAIMYGVIQLIIDSYLIDIPKL